MREIIERWPTVKALSEDMGVEYITAASWKRRGNIPPKYWRRMVEAAHKRGIALTLEEFTAATEAA